MRTRIDLGTRMTTFIRRPAPFGLFSTGHGTMIVNVNDVATHQDIYTYGVGANLLSSSYFEPEEISLAVKMLLERRRHFGDGVVAIDGGANLGVHTIEWAKAMYGWGTVIAFEAQERIAYALAGNITLNNCFNAKVHHAALGERIGTIDVPKVDYCQRASFGSLEIRPRTNGEFIGQALDYTREHCDEVKLVSIDSLKLKRLDFIKIDVEGMEIEVLRGARASIEQYKPIILMEFIKSDFDTLVGFATDFGYQVYKTEFNLLIIHESDASKASVL